LFSAFLVSWCAAAGVQLIANTDAPLDFTCFKMLPDAAGRCSFIEQRFAQKKINSQGIPCLLLLEAGRIGSIERIFKGFTRFGPVDTS
jgi:hypothetical protein